jgi:3-oxoacyl-[acyl-carrier protein] reductase
MDLGLTDKVAVVMGGDSGLGKATVELLAREGAKVTLIDKTLEAAVIAFLCSERLSFVLGAN